MASAEIEKQKVQEITEKLEQGLQELFESEKYKSYLNTMSKFHNYSYNNTMLIAMQKPDASLVAGYNAWQKGFERHVKKGEKGIRILAPAPYKVKEEQDVINPDTQELVLDGQGNPKKEVVEYTIPAFKVVPVFDVSQTEGKELPGLGANELLSSVEGYQDFMQALTAVSPVPIGFEDIPGDSKGYFHFEEKRIAIQEGMSDSQTIKTGVHEVSHAKLHDREMNKSADLQMEDFKDKNTKEVEAESIAYTVCQHFGIDTSDYSFGYIAGWSSGKDMKELKSSLDTIRKTASELITQIEDKLQELQHDRQQEQEQVNDGDENRFEIYQLKDTEETRGYRFMAMDYLEMKGIAVDRDNYELVYAASLGGMGLEDIYTKFNIDHPEDFTGHSLSVSDVVVLHQNGQSSSHYVDSIGYQEVPDFMKEHTAEKVNEAPKVSYFVIEDLATWKENSEKRSVLERFDNLYDAMAKFSQYKAEIGEYPNDNARTTLGVSIDGIEFDLLHVRESENYLVNDFAQIKVALENSQFLGDLQTMHDVIGFDKIQIHREMTPEEVKDFVKQRCEYQLKNSGIENISVYMDRFDLLYEHGKMEHLMPTANQKQVTDVLAVSEWENSYLEQREPEQLAYAIADRYVSIQSCTEGYDYSIFNEQYKLLDGGVYDNPDISIKEALHEVIVDLKEPSPLGGNDVVKGNVKPDDVLLPVDYEMLMEKTEEAEHIVDNRESSEVTKFRARTEELFHEINGQNPMDIEQTVYAHVQAKIDEYDIDVKIVDVVVSGSRCRGMESQGSDLDVVVELNTGEKEDSLFNVLNEDGLMIGGIKVDINPITEQHTGTLESYLPTVEAYLSEKIQIVAEETVAEKMQVTLTVAECGEFHNLGEFYEGINSVDEAIAIFNQIPPERMNGIRSIGINIHEEGTADYEDVVLDILSGNTIDLEILEYVPDITGNPKAMAIIAEIVEKVPSAEVLGSLEKWKQVEPSVIDQQADIDEATMLAVEIDQFCYDYDTYEYRDSVDDREEQVKNIEGDIASGEIEYLQDFLQEVIEEGQVEEDVQRAKELLQKLSEYKPLAKIEELEEANYNMIDNVINNEKPKKEQDCSSARSSIKEKLAEKKAAIEQREKTEKSVPEKEAEKKAEREI
ncbi:ssDNA-binding domain-containing protein [Lachnospiraceae bacterium OttesenSCG-928-D06]|nr:ssDNA-binding domain-containing protein [Lachnospiraceae bacterium OttesenSCG-928-D06]